ncbi:uncharacterized protein KY384_008155 [Bacidia gigantensis]|uniref:uncharacterized protein n=1 Tax=Bacidia gigantensis TaxID=2732470 RepID=UPI001D04CD59|nr:uncharacterized protein KY384_008155 [Bacidia gigantensis]KAG8526726.1 hypothetical protein KY384_008155 [Bacidia gigantensis]
MARNPTTNASPREIAAIDLNRVLVRLEHQLLSVDADPKLQHSSFERNKTSSNLEYARTLLLRLEHDASRQKITSRKAAAESTLSHQRALLKRLTDRMHKIEQTGDEADDYSDHSNDLLDSDNEGENQVKSAFAEAPAPASTAAQNSDRPPSPGAGLRNRFAPSASSQIKDDLPSTDEDNTTATLLQSSDLEASQLTSSLLSLAQQLKASTHTFSDSLKADDEALRRATEGLDNNETALEAAGKRMGMLRMMSEGQGLWGRMMLYAWIAGLWVAAILLVFVGPKLRF